MNLNPGVLDGVRRIGARFRDLAIDGSLPGAPLGRRMRGATTAGPPGTGTWRPGDEVADRTGNFWLCTAAGNGGGAEWTLLGPGEGWGPSPRSLGLALATCKPSDPTSGTALTSERTYWFLATATATRTLTTLGIYLSAAATGTETPGAFNGLAVATATGTLMGATADMSSSWNASLPVAGYNAVEGTLAAPQRVVAGTPYYLGLLAAMTAMPSAASAVGSGNRGAVNGFYPAQVVNSQTSFASFTPAASQNQAQWFFLYGR